jgi:hypothetical protein
LVSVVGENVHGPEYPELFGLSGRFASVGLRKYSPIRMTAPQGVRATQSDNLLIIEAAQTLHQPQTQYDKSRHIGTPCAQISAAAVVNPKRLANARTFTHVSQMVGALTGIRETTVGSDVFGETVDSAWTPRHLGPGHLL